MTTNLKVSAASWTLALAALVAALAAGPVAAQGYPPTNVTVVGVGTSATVAWIPVTARGVTYRVLRSPSAKEPGRDLTTPITLASFVDAKVEAGMTYFYQVIAVYGDGTRAAAEPVGFTMPFGLAAETMLAPVPIAVGLMEPTNPATLTGDYGYTLTQCAPSAWLCVPWPLQIQVRLQWPQVPGAAFYVLWGPGLPGTGFQLNTTVSNGVETHPTTYRFPMWSAGETTTPWTWGLSYTWTIGAFFLPGPVSTPADRFTKGSVKIVSQGSGDKVLP